MSSIITTSAVPPLGMVDQKIIDAYLNQTKTQKSLNRIKK